MQQDPLLEGSGCRELEDVLLAVQGKTIFVFCYDAYAAWPGCPMIHRSSAAIPALPAAEWGHSFRPAYFRLGAALAGSIQAQRVLALTATATRATEVAIRQVCCCCAATGRAKCSGRFGHAVSRRPDTTRPGLSMGAAGACKPCMCQHAELHLPRLHVLQVLRIPEGSVLRDTAVRQNLRLQVVHSTGGSSSQASRERACALFAAGGPLAVSSSAIVYCAFKEDANQLARMLGARGVSSRAYHAGKDYRVCVHKQQGQA